MDGTIATLYSGPSQGDYAPAVNTLLRGYLRVFEAGWNVEGDRTPIEVLSHRGDRVRRVMATLADSTTHEEFAIGLVKLDVGHF